MRSDSHAPSAAHSWLGSVPFSSLVARLSSSSWGKYRGSPHSGGSPPRNLRRATRGSSSHAWGARAAGGTQRQLASAQGRAFHSRRQGAPAGVAQRWVHCLAGRQGQGCVAPHSLVALQGEDPQRIQLTQLDRQRARHEREGQVQLRDPPSSASHVWPVRGAARTARGACAGGWAASRVRGGSREGVTVPRAGWGAGARPCCLCQGTAVLAQASSAGAAAHLRPPYRVLLQNAPASPASTHLSTSLRPASSSASRRASNAVPAAGVWRVCGGGAASARCMRCSQRGQRGPAAAATHGLLPARMIECYWVLAPGRPRSTAAP